MSTFDCEANGKVSDAFDADTCNAFTGICKANDNNDGCVCNNDGDTTATACPVTANQCPVLTVETDCKQVNGVCNWVGKCQDASILCTDTTTADGTDCSLAGTGCTAPGADDDSTTCVCNKNNHFTSDGSGSCICEDLYQ